MSKPDRKSPQANRSGQDTIKQLLDFLRVKEILKAQQNLLDREQQQVSTAQVPWLKLICFFSLYFLIGFSLSFLVTPWALIGWIMVIAVSTLLIVAAFHIVILESGCYLIDILLLSPLVDLLEQTIEPLSDAVKRYIFATSRDWALRLKLDLVPAFCFFVVSSLAISGLWLGYLIKTRVL